MILRTRGITFCSMDGKVHSRLVFDRVYRSKHGGREKECRSDFCTGR